MIQTEEKDFLRDTKTNALINSNVSAFMMHKARKSQAERLDKLEQTVCDMAKDFDEIKSMLRQLINR